MYIAYKKSNKLLILIRFKNYHGSIFLEEVNGLFSLPLHCNKIQKRGNKSESKNIDKENIYTVEPV